MVLFSFMFDARKSGILLKQLKHVVRDLDMLNKNEEARSTDPFASLDIEPTSKSLGLCLVSDISISSFKYKCYILMQMQYTKNLKPRI